MALFTLVLRRLSRACLNLSRKLLRTRLKSLVKTTSGRRLRPSGEAHLSRCFVRCARSWRGPRRRPTPSKQVFVQGLAELTAASAGTYGDEGARVGPALDTMARGARRMGSGDPGRSKPGLPPSCPRASPRRRRLRCDVTLGRMYVGARPSRRRVAELDAASRLEPQRADFTCFAGWCSSAAAQSAEASEAFRPRGPWTRATRSRPTTCSITAPSSERRRRAPQEDATRARETLSAAYRG